MRLDSVKSLREELSTKITGRLERRLPERDDVLQPYSVPSKKYVQPDGKPLRTLGNSLAFGTTRTDSGEYKLLVLIQNRKFRKCVIAEIEELKKAAAGEIVVSYVGRATARSSAGWCQKRHRPLRIGASIGHHLNTCGSLTCFVQEPKSNKTLILSNNHVLCHQNKAHADETTIQPGKSDKGCCPGDRIGELHRTLLLDTTVANQWDCAVSVLDDNVDFNPSDIPRGPKLSGLFDGNQEALTDPKLRVVKMGGRTTGRCKGKIIGVDMEASVYYTGVGTVKFTNLITIKRVRGPFFSAPGDSGTLVVDEEGKAIGVIFAGSNSNPKLPVSYAFPLAPCLEKMGVRLLH